MQIHVVVIGVYLLKLLPNVAYINIGNIETHYTYNLIFPSILSINRKDMTLVLTLHFVI
jgi:hypothetical protein